MIRQGEEDFSEALEKTTISLENASIGNLDHRMKMLTIFQKNNFSQSQVRGAIKQLESLQQHSALS